MDRALRLSPLRGAPRERPPAVRPAGEGNGAPTATRAQTGRADPQPFPSPRFAAHDPAHLSRSIRGVTRDLKKWTRGQSLEREVGAKSSGIFDFEGADGPSKISEKIAFGETSNK